MGVEYLGITSSSHLGLERWRVEGRGREDRTHLSDNPKHLTL